MYTCPDRMYIAELANHQCGLMYVCDVSGVLKSAETSQNGGMEEQIYHRLQNEIFIAHKCTALQPFSTKNWHCWRYKKMKVRVMFTMKTEEFILRFG